MPEYVQNPPKVEAVQWDGTLEGAKVIQEMLRESGRTRLSFTLKIYFEPDRPGWYHRDYLEFEEAFLGLETRGTETARFYSKYWLVRFPDGKLEAISDERFERDFSKTDDEDAKT